MKIRSLGRFIPAKSVVLSVLLAVGLTPFLGGCVVVAAGAAGAGAVAYVRGELKSTVPHAIDRTYAATQEALQELNFVKIHETKSGVDAELVYRTALDKKVEIELERVADGLTEVRIRIGVLGDQPLSLTILNKINAELK